MNAIPNLVGALFPVGAEGGTTQWRRAVVVSNRAFDAFHKEGFARRTQLHSCKHQHTAKTAKHFSGVAYLHVDTFHWLPIDNDGDLFLSLALQLPVEMFCEPTEQSNIKKAFFWYL